MKVTVPSRSRAREAFTLVEVMVSSVLVVLLMALLLQTVSQAQNLMSRTTAKVNQFKAARNAFEAMTRRLSQATLNTYYRAF
ncbi:MAG: prepilin-type N-terminal cleavage/methylation domain-containing protein, partial [Chthoniobacteraceae bacterium]